MITVNNLSFHFGTQTLFKDVNLKFSPGECYGVIGANGAGKSTFIRLLCRELDPSSGEILIPGSSVYYAMAYAVKGEMDLFGDMSMAAISIAGAMAVGILLVSTVVRIWTTRKFRKK